MAGIYIHIPFCKQRCYYCDFHTSINLKIKPKFIDALIKEIELQKDYLDNEEINTIYFGGGTPSLLSIKEIKDILNQIHKLHSVATDAEITLEANPDDLSKEYISELSDSRINRLSIGIQSFSDEQLMIMHRRHDSKTAIEAIKNCQAADFNNISIDLIYGLNEMSIKDWKEQIQTALSLNIQHISSYHLTYEEGTVFYHYLKTGKHHKLNDEESLNQFKLLIDLLKTAGFIHYEISNFALPGYFSNHNSSYWKQEKYLGLGPSAHSYNTKSRQWNISNNGEYIRNVLNGKPKIETEYLNSKTKYNEYIMTSLRTVWGIDLEYLNNTFDKQDVQHFNSVIGNYIVKNYAINDGKRIRLTQSGLFISDKVISDLFLV